MNQNEFDFVASSIREKAERLISEVANNANVVADLKRAPQTSDVAEKEQKTTKKESK